MEKDDKRVLRVELDDEVKKVSITGKDSEEKVVMRQELSEDDLELATGGSDINGICPPAIGRKKKRTQACMAV